MARQKTIAVACINIRTDPHSPERYLELLKDTFDLGKAVRLQGDQHLMLGAIDTGIEDKEVVTGSIARFTEIDRDLPWFNIDTFTQADDSVIEQIQIPENLKPNYTPFYFAFNPIQHIFAFETYNGKGITPATVLKGLEKLFSAPSIREKYGIVYLDIVADANKLLEIIGLARLKQLQITVQPPNPDDLGEKERKVLEKLRGQKACKMVNELEASVGQSLDPDKDTTDLAKIALTNGKVISQGIDLEGNSIKMSSEDHPFILKQKHDPDLTPGLFAFLQVARRALFRVSQMRL